QRPCPTSPSPFATVLARKRNRIGPHAPFLPTLTPQKSLPHGAMSIVRYNRPRDEKAGLSSDTVHRPTYALGAVAPAAAVPIATIATATAGSIDKRAVRWDTLLMPLSPSLAQGRGG